jgi:23S rRNA (cytidine1920-2'-O)/16S rRNA (cytidine1409-2'-O)-methyltransferase
LNVSSSGKIKLCDLAVERGLFATGDEAKRALLAGELTSPDVQLTQPSMLVDSSIELNLKNHRRFVSRGGEKLAGALAGFGCSPKGLRCLDVGASTGGFTDCLLQNGAAEVVALDVAYGQFAWQLRTDERVKVLERTNIRDVDPEAIGAPFDLIVVDVSFAPLSGLLPKLTTLLAVGEHNTLGPGPTVLHNTVGPGPSVLCSRGGVLIALVKPQFELPASFVGEGGVVRDPAAHARALEQAIEAATGSGLAVCGASFSPIKGPKGNIEFFLAAQWGGIPATIDIDDVVRRAHARLDG